MSPQEVRLTAGQRERLLRDIWLLHDGRWFLKSAERFGVVDSNTFIGHVLECYVHNMVSKAGTISIHQCTAKLRFNSWCRAMGLDGEVINDKNTSDCNGTCEITFKINWWK
jgi:hypothetical protein